MTKAAIRILENKREMKSQEQLILSLSKLAKEDLTSIWNLFQTHREVQLKAPLWDAEVLAHPESLAREAQDVRGADGSRPNPFSPIW